MKSRVRSIERRFPAPCPECSGPVESPEVVTTYNAEDGPPMASGPVACPGCGGPPVVHRVRFSMPGPPPGVT